MDAQLEIRTLLRDEFTRRKNKNSNYSLRSFARSLGVNPSALSEIMNSDRPITRKMGGKLLDGLSVDPKKHLNLQSMLQTRNSLGDAKYVLMDMDQYHLITDWQYYAVLSLAEVKGFKGEPEWIAKRLNISVRQAEQALQGLIRLELLIPNEQGKLVASGIQLTTTAEISNHWIRSRHLSNLELAKESLETDSLDIRDFSEITMAVDTKKLPKAKEMIKKFRRELCTFMESGSKNEVYKLCVQLFPLSKKDTL